MIRNWIAYKKAEFKVKAMVYGMIANIIDDKKDILAMVQGLFAELKDVPIEELRSELIGKIAEIIHEEDKDYKETAE